MSMLFEPKYYWLLGIYESCELKMRNVENIGVIDLISLLQSLPKVYFK